ncbi:MAG: VanZ family protein [Ignavibacteriales bacterium]|nr:VanZ family protein [Ignavibacteriales bacterium]
METPYGRFLPRDYVYEFAAFLVIILVIFVVYRFIKGTRKTATLLYWLFVFISIILSYRYLITAPIEIVHYPQYAILSILLALSLDPKKDKFFVIRILLIVTLLGIIDEAYQYLYLTKKSSDYLDFNDFLLNQIGAAIGIMMYYGFIKEPVIVESVYKISFSMKKIIMSLIALTILFTLLNARIYFRTSKEIEPGGFTVKEGKTVFYLERKPGKYGNWVEDDKGAGYFFILDPILGILFMILYGALFGTFDNRFYSSVIEIFDKKKKFFK